MGKLCPFEQLGEQFRELADRVAVLERGQGVPAGLAGGFWALLSNRDVIRDGDESYDTYRHEWKTVSRVYGGDIGKQYNEAIHVPFRRWVPVSGK